MLNGVSNDEITAWSKSGQKPLQITRDPARDGVERLSIAIDGLPQDDSVILHVPRCIPAIARTQHDDDVEPRAFLAGNFRLAAG